MHERESSSSSLDYIAFGCLEATHVLNMLVRPKIKYVEGRTEALYRLLRYNWGCIIVWVIGCQIIWMGLSPEFTNSGVSFILRKHVLLNLEFKKGQSPMVGNLIFICNRWPYLKKCMTLEPTNGWEPHSNARVKNFLFRRVFATYCAAGVFASHTIGLHTLFMTVSL